MEVVSLNQFAIKDKEIGNELEDINTTIKQKLKSKKINYLIIS